MIKKYNLHLPQFLFVCIIFMLTSCSGTTTVEDPNAKKDKTEANTAPTIKITLPIANTVFKTEDVIVFNGSSSDEEDGELTDSSLIWSSNISGEIGQGKEIRLKLSAAKHNITLRAIDSDGEQTTQSVSIEVVEPDEREESNQFPSANITSPNSYDEYLTNSNISFVGKGSDLEDGDLVDDQLIWTSDLDGEIGRGKNVSAKLSAGDHVVSLTVFDSLQQSSSSSINIFVKTPKVDGNPGKVVLPDDPEDPSTNNSPTAYIESPRHGESFAVGENIVLKGFGTDVEDAANAQNGGLSDEQLQWSSNQDGLLGNGRALSVNLSAGVHTLQLTATDSEGETDIRSITITISEPLQAISLNGRVLAQTPLLDVTVSAENVSTKSDVDGYFILENVPQPESGRLAISFSKDGYTSTQRIIQLGSSDSYSVYASLLRYHYSAVNDFSTAVHINVSDPVNASQNLAELDFPTDSVTSASARVDVAVGDPTLDSDRAVFPGEFIGVPSEASAMEIPLESLTFSEISLTDNQENKIIQFDKPVTVKLRLPAVYQIGGDRKQTYVPGDPVKGFVEWWSYDDVRSVWVREDANPNTTDLDNAKIVVDANGVLYAEAMINHPSWWGAHKTISEQACVCVSVIDENSQNLRGINIYAEGVSYSGFAGPVSTSAEGEACLTVNKSAINGPVERIKLYASVANSKLYYEVTSVQEGDEVSNEIFTPDFEGNSYFNTGSCANLQNDLLLVFNGKIEGALISEKTGAPISGYRIQNDLGDSVLTDINGKYVFEVPLDVEVSIFAIGLSHQSAYVTDSAVPAIVNFVLPNHSPVIQQVAKDPLGLIVNNASVLISVVASDADDDPLSYQWNLDGNGVLDSTNTSTVRWTAPAAGAGIDDLTVTVSDGSKQTQYRTEVVWGGEVGGSTFQVTVKDNNKSNRPVAGVRVILYSQDGKSYVQEHVKTTDEDGIANFGDVGRSLGTVSIDYIDILDSRSVNTFVNVPLGTLVYYVDDKAQDCTKDETLVKANVAFSADVASYQNWHLLPQHANGNATQVAEQIDICKEQVQTDGKVSLLAMSSTNGVLGKYGYVIDNPLSAGSIYTVPFDHEMDKLALSSGNTALITDLKITALRKNVEFPINYRSPFGISEVSFPVGFPADNYSIFTEFSPNASGTIVKTRKFYDALPQSMVFAVPDFQFSNISYDEPTKTFDWQFSGGANVNVYGLFMTVKSGSSNTSWRVWLPHTSSDWEVIDLPDSPFDDPNQPIAARIYSIHMSNASNLNEFWQLLSTGTMLNEITSNGFAVGFKEY